jgi:hypothetical protein
LPAASVLEQVTMLVPMGKSDPDGGSQLTDTFVSQLSIALMRKWTIAPVRLEQGTRISDGQKISGGVVSRTVTLKVHSFVPVNPSVATQRTTVVPGGNSVPGRGKQVSLNSPSQ